MVPVPIQMIGVAASAIIWRANIPIGLVLVWITNPFTIPPIFYGAYLLGSWLLGTPGVAMPEELTIHWFRQSLGEIWIPLLTGSFIIGLFLSVISYFFIDLLWRYTVRKRWKNRPGFNRQS